MNFEVTRKSIEQDIETFKDRIEQARSKLSKLPKGFLPYPEHKKREKQKKAFKAEIEHVQKLISIAREGLADCEF